MVLEFLGIELICPQGNGAKKEGAENTLLIQALSNELILPTDDMKIGAYSRTKEQLAFLFCETWEIGDIVWALKLRNAKDSHLCLTIGSFPETFGFYLSQVALNITMASL